MAETSETYILLVEGADLSTYNPDFDWSRYLPVEVPMERVEHDKYVYFMSKLYQKEADCLDIIDFSTSFSNSSPHGVYVLFRFCSSEICIEFFAFLVLTLPQRLHTTPLCFTMR
jgi:hypothetical protein